MGGPAFRDRTCGSAPRRTHRSLPRPALRSVAYRKDGLELPLDLGFLPLPLFARSHRHVHTVS